MDQDKAVQLGELNMRKHKIKRSSERSVVLLDKDGNITIQSFYSDGKLSLMDSMQFTKEEIKTIFDFAENKLPNQIIDKDGDGISVFIPQLNPKFLVIQITTDCGTSRAVILSREQSELLIEMIQNNMEKI